VKSTSGVVKEKKYRQDAEPRALKNNFEAVSMLCGVMLKERTGCV